jgi:Holliday junction resolvasome RuvABC endonuclease subunit
MYSIHSVGIDLASVRSGLGSISFNEPSWKTDVLDVTSFDAHRLLDFKNGEEMPEILRHMALADQLTEWVNKQNPDIVGLEDYTHQPATFVGFSFGQIGGLVRHHLLHAGHRVLLIKPNYLRSFVSFRKQGKGRTNSVFNKELSKRWVMANLLKPDEEITDVNAKETEDIAEALIYAAIAAIVFSCVWLRKVPPMDQFQRAVFYGLNLTQRTSGLLNRLDKCLLRLPEAEAKRFKALQEELLHV